MASESFKEEDFMERPAFGNLEGQHWIEYIPNGHAVLFGKNKTREEAKEEIIQRILAQRQAKLARRME